MESNKFAAAAYSLTPWPPKPGTQSPSRLLAVLRGVAVIAVTLLSFPGALWYYARSGGGASREAIWRRQAISFVQTWSRRVLRVLGVRVRASGPLPPEGALILPNHMGYLDILVFGSLMPAVFLSRVEIRGWPVIGTLIRMSGHLFIDRNRLRDVSRINEEIAALLRQRFRLIAFIEGTSGSGADVLPFRSSLTNAAYLAKCPVVPAAIRYDRSDPSISVEADVAYWGEHAFGSHLPRLFGLRGIVADVTFGAPIDPLPESRQQLAAEARNRVRALYFSDRPVPPDPADSAPPPTPGA